MKAFYTFKTGTAQSVVLRHIEDAIADVNKGCIKSQLVNTATGLYVTKIEVEDVSHKTAARIAHQFRDCNVDVVYERLVDRLESRERFIGYLDDKIFELNLNPAQSEDTRALISVIQSIKTCLAEGGESMNCHFGKVHYFTGHLAHALDQFVMAVERFSAGTGEISSRPMTQLSILITSIGTYEHNGLEKDFGAVTAEAQPLLERYIREDHEARMATAPSGPQPF
jgi:hypothetical protein